MEIVYRDVKPAVAAIATSSAVARTAQSALLVPELVPESAGRHAASCTPLRSDLQAAYVLESYSRYSL